MNTDVSLGVDASGWGVYYLCLVVQFSVFEQSSPEYS